MGARGSSRTRKLPVESIETNIKGVYSFVPPRKGLDLSTAGSVTLLKHGVLFRPPDREREPRRFAFWQKFATEIWTEDNFVIPVFEPSGDLPHNLKGPIQRVSPNNARSNNWGGVALRSVRELFPPVLDSWVGAMGIWNVPTVSAPQGKYAVPADDDQYHSASWVGLDGAWAHNPSEPTASQDTLQAGIAQNVNTGITTQDQPGGIGLYSAWAEWITPAFPDNNARIRYPYLAPQTIPNLPVNPGDQITVVVQYVQHRGDNISNPSPPPGPYHFGAVLIVNLTTGKTANFYWPPPPQASFAGDSAEWVMELNDGYVLPAFSTINFTEAEACDVADAPPSGVTGTELQDGTVVDLVDHYNFTETKAAGAGTKVTIQYVPPPLH